MLHASSFHNNISNSFDQWVPELGRRMKLTTHLHLLFMCKQGFASVMPCFRAGAVLPCFGVGATGKRIVRDCHT